MELFVIEAVSEERPTNSQSATLKLQTNYTRSVSRDNFMKFSSKRKRDRKQTKIYKNVRKLAKKSIFRFVLELGCYKDGIKQQAVID